MTERIGKYQIQAEIGRGGFGQVFRAFDPTVGRHVAIKVLTTGSDRDLVTRFRNEAASAGKLRHKNIVTIYDFGEYSGTPYIVMELLEGADLQQVIADRAPLTLLQKIRMMAQVAQGLHAAHQSGLVHRDIKPANIMLLTDGSVKIMDFGIARLTQDASTRLTQKGSLIGSVRYMSPEQFKGLDTDALCDIWSYGVIYYELLTYDHPFGPASEPAALMYNITNSEPKSLRLIAPDIPEAIERLVRRALEKDREARYQSADDMYYDAEPVMVEMQRDRAALLLKQAEELAAHQHLHEAAPLLREILDLDPGNRRARELREAAQAKPARKPMPPVVDALVKTGEQELNARRFAEAIQNFESALHIDPNNSQIRILIDQARTAQERNVIADRLLAEARSNLENQKLTAAYNNVSRALESDPDNTAAKTLLHVIWQEIEQRDGEHGTVSVPAVKAVTMPPPPAAPVRPSSRDNPINRSRLLMTGGVAALIFIGAAIALPRLLRNEAGGFEITSSPPGASIKVANQTCVTPACKLELAAGTYQLEARLEGYRPLVRSFTAGSGSPGAINLTLEALPASVHISTNFESGKVSLDGRPAGDLRGGEWSLNSVGPGRHLVKVAGRDGEAAVRFNIAAGKPPALSGPVEATDVQAIVVANLGNRAHLTANVSGGAVTVDGKPAGQAGSGGLELTGFTEGTHEIRIGERSVIVGGRPAPALNVFLTADRNAGTLVVETGEDNASVFVNNRRHERPTSQGLVRIPLNVNEYMVRVEKPGFSNPPTQRVEIRKGSVERLTFKLTPLTPVLAVRGALPGTQVSVDGRLLGATDADGNFSAAVPAGDHSIELSKERHRAKRTQVRFESGRTVQLGGAEVELAELPPPPQPKPQPPPQQAQQPVIPAPPPKPDPRVLEAQAWEQVRNSRDIAALEDFRRKHPGSDFAEQAARRIEQVEWEAVNKQDAAALRTFAQKHPGGALAQQALAEAAKVEQAHKAGVERQAIQQLLSRYESAYQTRDADALEAVWPSIPPRTLASIRTTFRNARSISLDLNPAGEANISGDTATLVCRRTLQQSFGDKPLQNQDTITLKLRRQGVSWVIESIQ
jgi:serine/threonine protein kinase